MADIPAELAECMEARRTLLITLDEMRTEENASYELIARQGDLLTGVVNALRGVPPPDTSWSHHDAAELAAQMKAERDQLSIDWDVLAADFRALERRKKELEALLQEMHKSNHVLAAAAVPPSARSDFSVACACGHAPEEHGHDPQYPGSTACTVEGCDCIAYERGE